MEQITTVGELHVAIRNGEVLNKKYGNYANVPIPAEEILEMKFIEVIDMIKQKRFFRTINKSNGKTE